MAKPKDNQTRRQVLFVDDETEFLQVVKEAFGSLSRGQWEIHTASTADAALDHLKRQKMDLVVVDVVMPLLDGVQFLQLLAKRYPDLKKVSFTGLATEDKRTACLAAGAELFIEKPQSTEGYKSVYAMLDDLMSWAPQQGFQGMLRRVGLQDVIQMECLGRNSSVLEIYNENVLGRIYIEEGNIIHAAGADLTGEPALQRLLALSGGSFELVPFEPPTERTISGPWEFLLMEAARVRDEMASQAPAAQAPAEPRVEQESPATAEAPRVRVVETLICSAHGKPLYEDGCQDVPGRVLMLKNVARHAEQLRQVAMLGDFDRLEMQFPGGRLIAQARPERLVFVAVANMAETAGDP